MLVLFLGMVCLMEKRGMSWHAWCASSFGARTLSLSGGEPEGPRPTRSRAPANWFGRRRASMAPCLKHNEITAPSAAYLKFLHHKRRIRSRNFK